MRKPEKNRSRRLRKKLHLGEFKEWGFEFSAKVKGGIAPETVAQVLDRFILEAIEARELELGGWLDGGFIAHSGRGSASEADRQAISDWLEACGVLESIQIGELTDAWYLASD